MTEEVAPTFPVLEVAAAVPEEVEEVEEPEFVLLLVDVLSFELVEMVTEPSGRVDVNSETEVDTEADSEAVPDRKVIEGDVDSDVLAEAEVTEFEAGASVVMDPVIMAVDGEDAVAVAMLVEGAGLPPAL